MSAAADFVSMSNVNGVIRPSAEARVPVLDRGFLYGDSVYEVFRTYGGVPLFYDEHWARFENSAALTHMRLGLSKEAMTQAIRDTVRASGAAELKRDVYVRYIVTRGEGPLDLLPAAGLKPCYVIIVKEVPAWKPEFYSRGVKLAVVGIRRNAGSTLDPNIKGGNYLNNVLGVIEAHEYGADDCLMLNDAELVTEASNSNVFFVIDGELITPSQAAANLRGLTKAAVHKACRAHGLASDEREIPVADLGRASECFVTSATREIMPVRSLRLEDGSLCAFPDGGGEITRRVAGYYREYVADHVKRHAGLSLY